MYACVLIPRSLSLVLTLHPNPRAVLEMSATVWSNQYLYPGYILYPDEGELRLDKLEVYSVLADDDVRRQFGGYDVIQDVDGQEVRHCNWIRFVKVSSDPDEANIIASRLRGDVFYQVIKVIKPNDELVVLFHKNSMTSFPERLTVSNTISNGLPNQAVRERSSPRLTPAKPDDDEDDDDDNIIDVGGTEESEMLTSHDDDNEENKDDGHSDEAESVCAAEAANEDTLDLKIKQEKTFEEDTDNAFTGSAVGTLSDNKEDYCKQTESAEEKEEDNHSEYSDENDLPVREDKKELHHSMDSDQSSVTEDRVTPSGVLVERSPCRVLPPDTTSHGPLPLEVGAPVRRARERTWWPCDMCPKKFDRPSLLKRHVRTHTGEKPHACDVCGKAFSTSSSLNTHRRIHSGEKPHQCPICGKRFTASSNLYYHRMTHNKEKPHKCTLCSKSFPTPGDLRSHMYVHSGSWPYRCHVCNRGFSKHTNLKNHLLLHSGDKPHECSKCGKRFALQCNLKTHLKTHEVDSATSCSKCGVMFSDKDRKMMDGTCSKCFDPDNPAITTAQRAAKPNHHATHITTTTTPPSQAVAVNLSSSGNGTYAKTVGNNHTHQDHISGKKQSAPSDFSINKITDRRSTSVATTPSFSASGPSSSSSSASSKSDNSPDVFHPGMCVSSSPMISPFGTPFYGHRPWIMAAGRGGGSPVATVGVTSPPPALQYASSPTMMASVMKDMAAAGLPAYTMFHGRKSSGSVTSFVSPDVLARGGCFLPAAHTPSPYPLTPTSGWKQQPLA